MQAYSMYTCWINWLPIGDSFFQKNCLISSFFPPPPVLACSYPVFSCYHCSTIVLMSFDPPLPPPMHSQPPPTYLFQPQVVFPLDPTSSGNVMHHHKLVTYHSISPLHVFTSIWTSGPLFHLTSTWISWMCPFERCFLVFCYIVFPTTHCGPWLDMQRQLLPKTF